MQPFNLLVFLLHKDTPLPNPGDDAFFFDMFHRLHFYMFAFEFTPYKLGMKLTIVYLFI